jgi:hypothetical protein
VDLRAVLFDFAETLGSELYFATLGPTFQTVVKQAILTGENNARWWETRGKLGTVTHFPPIPLPEWR